VGYRIEDLEITSRIVVADTRDRRVEECPGELERTLVVESEHMTDRRADRPGRTADHDVSRSSLLLHDVFEANRHA